MLSTTNWKSQSVKTKKPYNKDFGKTMNTIHCIAPYRHPQAPDVWVFDDPKHGLDQEPFVGATNKSLDDLDAELQAGGKLTILFSASPLPDASLSLTAMSKTEHARTHGCSYHDGTREIWLCPAMMHYFPGDTAPDSIHLKVQAGSRRPEPDA
jgi:hypothetical protein